MLRRNKALSIEGDNHHAGICSKEPEQVERKALEYSAKRKAEGLSFSSSGVIRERFSIRFEIWAVRPCDWDNYATGTKFVQDLLVEAGILPGDSYDFLEGKIISLKAKSKKEERTEITIEQL